MDIITDCWENGELQVQVTRPRSISISRYKTSTTSWLMLAKKGQHDLNFFYRDRPMYDSWDDPTTKNAVFAVYQRHTDSEYGSWKGTDGSTG